MRSRGYTEAMSWYHIIPKWGIGWLEQAESELEAVLKVNSKYILCVYSTELWAKGLGLKNIRKI